MEHHTPRARARGDGDRICSSSVTHGVVGDLTLAYESMDLRADPDLTMTIHSAEPDSPTAHALVLLASWATASNDAAVRV